MPALRPITRDKLRIICGDNLELIKFMEALFDQLGESVPAQLIELKQRVDGLVFSDRVTQQQAMQAMQTALRTPRAVAPLSVDVDAGGAVLSVDGAAILAGINFADAQNVLANRIFGSR